MRRRNGQAMEPDFYPTYFVLEGRHWWFVGRRTIFLRLLRSALQGRDANLEILDFGCGTGAFIEHLEPFGRVRAVDADQQAVAFCHARGRTEVEWVPAGAPLPFPDDSFDLITSLDVLEHIEDDVAALEEMKRVLRPDGILLLAVPAFQFLWGDQDEISRHFRRYRRPELARKLSAAGLSSVKATYFNTWLFPPIAAVRLLRRLHRAPVSDKTDFSVGPSWINGALGALFGSEARWIIRRSLPFGVSLLALARPGR